MAIKTEPIRVGFDGELPTQNEADERPEEEQGGGRGMDPELRTMGSMLRQLEKLDKPARARVVAWLSSRCEVEP